MSTHSIGSPKSVTGRGCMKRLPGPAKIIAVLLDTNGESPLTLPPLKVIDVRLQVADMQHRLAGCGYDGRVVRVEGEIDVVQGWGHVVDIQTSGHGSSIHLSFPSPHDSTR